MLGSDFVYAIDGKGLKKRLLGLYIKLFGVPELHSHVRWVAIKRLIEDRGTNLEVGGGWGLMSFEFVKSTGKPIDVVEPDEDSLRVGVRIISRKGEKRVTFIQDKLPYLTSLISSGKRYDQILLIDVLEHVNEDLESLKTINKLLKRSGLLIISVPTPLYPRYFGREFAMKIGHVRDGYTIEELNKLLSSAGFEILEWRYHTTLLTKYLCSLWYRYRLPYIARLLLFPMLLLLAKFDVQGRRYVGCGLAVKARKVKEVP